MYKVIGSFHQTKSLLMINILCCTKILLVTDEVGNIKERQNSNDFLHI
ncbi:hypothetical protein HMPREF1173_01636 [Prevotella nigrescens CC14M]|uniref:Uncharacterized protein n=1 Tax=Prevotella nigrescens CC14M TaxID=1073366 RepID=V8CMQ6_9BACT|nr:hypothetical protein HMPREF1173_01636 [Prevotella nigrescens CC14M]